MGSNGFAKFLAFCGTVAMVIGVVLFIQMTQQSYWDQDIAPPLISLGVAIACYMIAGGIYAAGTNDPEVMKNYMEHISGR